jgi:hypothetical protein
MTYTLPTWQNSDMPTKVPPGKKIIHMCVDEAVFRALDQYRFKHQFQSKTAAHDHLLRYALEANPPKPEDGK